MLNIETKNILISIVGRCIERLKYGTKNRFKRITTWLTPKSTRQRFLLSQNEEDVIILTGDKVCVLELKSWTIYRTGIEQPNIILTNLNHKFNAIVMDSGDKKYVLVNGYFRSCYNDDMIFIAKDLVHLIMSYYCDESMYYIDHRGGIYTIAVNTLYDNARSFSDTYPWFQNYLVLCVVWPQIILFYYYSRIKFENQH